MILLALLLLGCVAVPQMTLSVYCISRFAKLRWLSIVALTSASLQVLSALFAERVVTAFHTPTSLDPLADGFEILGEALIVTILFVAVSLLIHTVLLIRMNQTAR